MPRPTNDELNALKSDLEQRIERVKQLEERLESLLEESESCQSSFQSKEREIEESWEKVQGLEKNIDDSGSNIISIEETADQEMASIKKHAEESNLVLNAIKEQSEKADALITKVMELKKSVESLLPGATSAGLASAFKDRKESFKWPKRLWGFAFIVSIIALIVVASFSSENFPKLEPSYSGLLFYVLHRLPFALPFIWSGLFSARRYNKALRLEEDYAHKEALSKSFEGYKAQILQIEEEAEISHESILFWINKVLENIALHPDRIYQSHHGDITPLSMLKDVTGRKKDDECRKES